MAGRPRVAGGVLNARWTDAARVKAAQLDPHFVPQHLGGVYDQCGNSLMVTAPELAAMAPSLTRSFGMRNVTFPDAHHGRSAEEKGVIVAALARQAHAAVDRAARSAR